jgi:hypothetical protein
VPSLRQATRPVTMPHVVPPTREAEFTRDWADGMLVRLMTEKYQCTPASIANTVRRLRLPARHRHRAVALAQTEPDVALTGGDWYPNGRGTMVWATS